MAHHYNFLLLCLGKGKSTKGKLKRSSPSQDSKPEKPAKKTCTSVPDPAIGRSVFKVADYTIPRRVEPFSQGAASLDLGQETMQSSVNKFKPNTFQLMSNSMTDLDTLATDMGNLILDSKAKSTWNKHFSAWKLYTEFCTSQKLTVWPATPEKSRVFATWALRHRHLKSDTVKSYISSLTVKNTLDSHNVPPLVSDPVTKMILKGADKLELCAAEKNKPKLTVNPHMLKVLGHRVSIADWQPISKQVVWAAILTCFFTSCRMGELLAPNEYSFNPIVTLKWTDIRFLDNDGALLFLPFTKTNGSKGEVVDLFYFTNPTFCPVVNLLKLRKMLVDEQKFDVTKPVFMFSSGIMLTKTTMNQILNSFLSDTFDSNNFKITCHSFRAGIPTLLAGNVTDDGANCAKKWGRWATDSFKLYTKDVRSERKCIYDLVAVVLCDSLK